MNIPADTVLVNGKIITVDAAFTLHGALAIAGERIAAVGSAEDMQPFIGPRTRVIDLGGKAVLPGLIDGHAHLEREGLKSVYPSLGRVRSIADIQARIAELARTVRPGEWIVTMPIGDPPSYFDVPGVLEEGRFPNRHELDLAAPENPVYIRPVWGYWRTTTPLVSIANTRALALAGVDRHSAPPAPSVRIDRDGAGDPTGVFYEDTFVPLVELTLMRAIPGFTRADRARTLPASFRAYHAFGTTSVFEAHGAATELIRAYKDVRRKGEMSTRVALALSPNWGSVGAVDFKAFVNGWLGWLGEPALGDDYLKITGLYVELDPNAENAVRATALPYTGWAGFNYDAALPRDRAKELLIECARNDIRVVGITPGMAELFYEVHQVVPLTGRRWVYGHISILSMRDIERIAEMDLVVTAHPNRYIYKEGHLHARRLGRDRENEIAPLRSLLERGIRVTLSTDNVPVTLFYPIWQAVARRSRTNEVVAEAERLTREQAIRCATSNGAWLTFDEASKGSIEPGKLADLAVLDADPLAAEEDALKDIAAEMTFVGGRLVYTKDAR